MREVSTTPASLSPAKSGERERRHRALRYSSAPGLLR
jgi:hypothetical protein